ncbi:elongation factor P 5-aminopentanone reductase [Virgibacillus oceani]|uniref:Oxidoreductase YmfI n=1 Tax=Virgibacillus oceani TaxID=1479511 RepID=A0A917H663_9BACI|nr:SDR family oxidoreductase [Virgibacillus oceani]GGG68579.1 putative oxidoreductase YmfI [Virgibacillus oceani]
MGQNVLIIGASGDIGAAIAERLAADGYHLLLHYHSNKKAIDTLRERLTEERILMELKADLRTEHGVNLLLEKLVLPVDSIIFAGGNALYGLFQQTNIMDMEEMLALHVKAPWVITRSLLPQLIRNKSGNIIFITSIWGEVGASHEVIYSSVKGAQNSFVKALAKEVAPSGISVNAVSPGFIDTKMNDNITDLEREAVLNEIPMNRAGLPAEVAHTVRFLLDDQSNYIQGEIIRINGGW